MDGISCHNRRVKSKLSLHNCLHHTIIKASRSIRISLSQFNNQLPRRCHRHPEATPQPFQSRVYHPLLRLLPSLSNSRDLHRLTKLQPIVESLGHTTATSSRGKHSPKLGLQTSPQLGLLVVSGVRPEELDQLLAVEDILLELENGLQKVELVGVPQRVGALLAQVELDLLADGAVQGLDLGGAEWALLALGRGGHVLLRLLPVEGLEGIGEPLLDVLVLLLSLQAQLDRLGLVLALGAPLVVRQVDGGDLVVVGLGVGPEQTESRLAVELWDLMATGHVGVDGDYCADGATHGDGLGISLKVWVVNGCT
ncbi:hypothetical protein M426DRAFT_78571 [Hypoxylon sp. CI-4A]|nr:hypothetical protein M426DRAFT_78571 [Hypoxylon sp. CI-4A]